MIDQSARSAEQLDDLVGELAEEFSQRMQAGEVPTVEEYAERYPHIAEIIRQLFPALEVMGETTLARPADDKSRSEAKHGLLGDYRILREIGRGGMGVVYEAEQLSLNRRVALKILPFAAALDERHIKRFRNEALAAAQLDHPHIVDVYGVGCERSVHFYAMRYIEGVTLADLIADLREASQVDAGSRAAQSESRSQNTDGDTAFLDTPLLTSLSTQLATSKRSEFFRSLAQVAVKVAEALDHAHQQGVVHRDIKPGNIMIDARAKAWVTDFGLAHMETEASLTMSGDLLGTLRYMSPEQALAKRIVVDHRSDIYSLGVTLYELLTLQPAFPQSDRQELLRQIAFEEPVAPRKINHQIPAQLETIVCKAISKNPRERYETAQEFADDLQRFLDDRPIVARPPRVCQRISKWTWRHRNAVLMSGFATMLMLTLGVVMLMVSNRMISDERDAREQALIEASQNLENARNEQRRAEDNLDLAIEALDRVYLDQIVPDLRPMGNSRKTQDRPPSAQERELLETGLEFYARLLEDNADSVAARFRHAKAHRRSANLYLVLGDWERGYTACQNSLAGLEELVREFPQNEIYLANLGLAYYKRGQFQQKQGRLTLAVDDFTKAIELHQGNDECLICRARAYIELGKPEKALRDLDAMGPIKKNRDSNYYHRYNRVRSDALILLEKPQQLVQETSQLIDGEPENHALYYLRARAYLKLRDKDRALVDLNRAIELLPEEIPANSYDYFGKRGDLLVAEGDYQAAVADFDQVLKFHPQFAHVNKRRAWAYFRLGNYQEAIADLRTAVRGAPNDYTNLTWDSLSTTAACPDATFRKQFLQLTDEMVSLNNASSSALITAARIHASFVNYEKAFEYMRSVELENKGTLNRYYQIALCALAEGNLARYSDICRQMVGRFEKSKRPAEQYFTAWTCALSPAAVDDYENPISLAQQASASDPSNPAYLTALGAILLRAGRIEEALNHLEAATDEYETTNERLRSSPAYTCYLLAIAHHQIGNTDAADRWLQQATELSAVELSQQSTLWNRRLTLQILGREAERCFSPAADKLRPLQPLIAPRP